MDHQAASIQRRGNPAVPQLPRLMSGSPGSPPAQQPVLVGPVLHTRSPLTGLEPSGWSFCRVPTEQPTCAYTAPVQSCSEPTSDLWGGRPTARGTRRCMSRRPKGLSTPPQSRGHTDESVAVERRTMKQASSRVNKRTHRSNTGQLGRGRLATSPTREPCSRSDVRVTRRDEKYADPLRASRLVPRPHNLTLFLPRFWLLM